MQMTLASGATYELSAESEMDREEWMQRMYKAATLGALRLNASADGTTKARSGGVPDASRPKSAAASAGGTTNSSTATSGSGNVPRVNPASAHAHASTGSDGPKRSHGNDATPKKQVPVSAPNLAGGVGGRSRECTSALLTFCAAGWPPRGHVQRHCAFESRGLFCFGDSRVPLTLVRYRLAPHIASSRAAIRLTRCALCSCTRSTRTAFSRAASTRKSFAATPKVVRAVIVAAPLTCLLLRRSDYARVGV